MNRTLFIKSIVYRLSSASITFFISFALTGSFKAATLIGILDGAFKIFYYYSFELFFDKIMYQQYGPCVIWLTGLSGSGKTTIANELHCKLNKRNVKCIILDGDEIRNAFNNNNFDKQSRIQHNINVAYMAALLEKQGYIVIVSLISPFIEARDKSRSICNRFIEVFISTPLDICEMRDVKGLYLKARKGDIKDFTGITSPYEIPLNPELTIDTTIHPLGDCVGKIIKTI